MKPGIYEMAKDDYHALKDMLSASVAKLLLEKSPAHARYARDNPSANTKQSDRGTVAHALLFEGVDCAMWLDYPDWRTKASQEAREAAREAGKIPVLTKDQTAICEMTQAALNAWNACPDLEGYRPANGEAERVLIWGDKGVLCRARPDWISHDRRVIIDGKFTEMCAAPEQAPANLVNRAFDQRAAFYVRGAQELARTETKYLYLFQETEPPYCTSIVGVAPAMLELGMRKVDHALTVWENCVTNNDWPGYDSRIAWADPPDWAIARWGMR